METRNEAITRAETVSTFLLWYGVLAGPLVWAGQLLLDYGLDEAVACAPGSRAQGMFFNVGIGTVIQIVNAVATALTLLALVVSYRCYRRLRADDSSRARRATWMAEGGIFVSALFLTITVLKFASPLLLSGCSSTL